jgi:hypothetical protein
MTDLNRVQIIDNDHGEITAKLHGKEVRGWSYANDEEHYLKIRMAHEYAVGWGGGMEHMKQIKDYLRSIHIRHQLRTVLTEFEGMPITKEVCKSIVDKFWPKKEIEE